jgi:alkanesulfonate monooxygenase SsuD/methylene tetrahydromethanopterin reductase-like flavin-dependent oxidoreductase (luciferase family)
LYLLVYTKELRLNIGISVPLLTYKVDVVFMARQAEALGFESFWYTGHLSYQCTAIAEAVMR